MSLKSDLKQLLKPYYIFNIFMSISYIIFKKLPGVCQYLFEKEECEFNGRETEILFFLAIVVMIRTRKAGSVTMVNYLTSSFIYTKVANLILWFNADFLMGIIYGIVFILGALLLPEPTYSGPDNITYFLGAQGLEDELRAHPKITWLVAFYTVWNPACVTFAPVFAELSTKYHLHNLRFGKVDVGRYANVAMKYNINDSSFSKQLPTLILFQDGKEIMRRPGIEVRGKVKTFLFSSENIIDAFELKDLYDTCKSKLKTTKAIKSD